MMDNIHDLYQELILDHNAHPHNYGELENANRKAIGHNPLCGDDVAIFVRIDDHHITDVKFIGQGCAISKSSASIMTDEMIGKTLEEAERIFQDFHALLTSPKSNLSHLGKAAAFAGVREFPARVKCATLAWHTFRAALDEAHEAVTTE